MDWDDLRFFITLARDGSVRAAAATLGVNQSTVSRRINAFEKTLGIRLFKRLPSGYTLTQAGEEMLAPLHRVEEEIAALDRKVFGQDSSLSGNLRVTMPEPLAVHLLMPDLAAFAENYPGLDLELGVSYEKFNLSKREADVAIRITNAPSEHLIGRKIANYARAAYATEGYLDRSYPSGMNWIGWEDGVSRPTWVKESGFPTLKLKHDIDNVIVQFAAAKAGLGVSLLPCFMGDQEPTLSRVPPGDLLPGWGIWVLAHKDLRDTARISIFTSFMAEAISKHRDLLEGRCPQELGRKSIVR